MPRRWSSTTQARSRPMSSPRPDRATASRDRDCLAGAADCLFGHHGRNWSDSCSTVEVSATSEDPARRGRRPGSRGSGSTRAACATTGTSLAPAFDRRRRSTPCRSAAPSHRQIHRCARQKPPRKRPVRGKPNQPCELAAVTSHSRSASPRRIRRPAQAEHGGLLRSKLEAVAARPLRSAPLRWPHRSTRRRRSAACQLREPTARASSAFDIFERPLTPLAFASLVELVTGPPRGPSDATEARPGARRRCRRGTRRLARLAVTRAPC
jgi:hypothetical protein